MGYTGQIRVKLNSIDHFRRRTQYQNRLKIHSVVPEIKTLISHYEDLTNNGKDVIPHQNATIIFTQHTV
jgi:hypothetical protein